jgi:hypothetical protein
MKKEGEYMSKVDKNKTARPVSSPKNSIDRVDVTDHLNSDNAFSDVGLENARMLEKAINKDITNEQ